jgi:ribosome maturation factor RimP
MKTSFDRHAEDRVRDIAARVTGTLGLELVFVEFLRGPGRMTVRLTIDKEGGVTLDDCAGVSRQVGADPEMEDVVSVPYNLEVSSPGLDRRLVRTEDYERFKGRNVKISLSSPLNGQRNFQGVLAGLEGETVLLEVAGGGAALRLPLSAVEVARLIPEF